MKILSVLFILVFQSMSVFAETIYPDHIKKEAIDLFEKGLELKNKKQFKQARPFFDKAIALNIDFELARYHRGLKKDYDFLIASKSTVSSIPYYRIGRSLLSRGQVDKGFKLLLMGAKIDNTGIIKVKITKDWKAYSANKAHILLSTETVGKLGEPRKLGYIVVKDTIYAFGFESIKENMNAKITIGYGDINFTSNSVIVKGSQMAVGECYSKQVLELKTKVAEELFNNSFSRVAIKGEKDHSGVKIRIDDPYGKNQGFKYETVTDKRGFFKVGNLPNGPLYIHVSKPGYVAYNFSIIVDDQNIFVEKKYSDKELFFPDDDLKSSPLEEVILPLYKVEKYKITYTVQKQKNQKSFIKGDISKGERLVSVGIMSDWVRGGYHKKGSAVTFLNKNYKGSDIDLVFFHTKNGAYISRQIPFTKQKPIIALLDKPYESIKEVGQDVVFRHEALLVVGRTYIVKLNQKDGDYFAKFTLSK